MKLFVKVTLAVTLLLSVVLSVCGYLMIERNFSDSLEFATQRTIEQQRRDVNHVRNLLFSNEDFRTNPDGPFTYNLTVVRMEDAGAQLAIYGGNMQSFLSSLPPEITKEEQLSVLEKKEEGYSFRKYGERQVILFATSLDIPNRDVWMLSAYDISDVFLSRQAQLKNLLQISLLTLGGGLVVALAFSLLLTAPINKLKTASLKIANGDYSRRTGVRSLDETGELSRNFDSMADAIEEKIQTLNDNIERQNEFVAAFTHEIKTPMTSIVGYSAMLRSKERDEETSREYIDYIHSESKRLELLSQKLLRLMGLREEEIEMRPISLREIFADTKKSLSLDERMKNVGFKDCDAAVLADEGLLIDLLRNLILNALDAVENEGEVSVFCDLTDESVTIFVEDNGIGIPKDEISKITEAFYMVDKSRSHDRGGSGIGLALAARIALLHGSALAIESKESEGTVVSFSLRRVPKEVGDE